MSRGMGLIQSGPASLNPFLPIPNQYMIRMSLKYMWDTLLSGYDGRIPVPRDMKDCCRAVAAGAEVKAARVRLWG